MQSEQVLRSSIFSLFTDDWSSSGLLKYHWHMFQTSLLVKKDDDLKNRVQQLLCRLGTTLKNKKVDVRISLCPALQYRDTSSKPILVEVCVDETIEYTGYFMNFSTTPVDDFESFPLLLAKGKVDFMKKVNRTLENVLNMVVYPLRLNALQLASLFTVFAGHTLEEEKGMAELKFTIPGLPESNCIKPKIMAKHLNPILDFYCENIDFLEEPVEVYFYEKVLQHLLRIYEIDFTKAELKEVTFPGASISAEGKVYIRNEETLLDTLGALHTLIFQEKRPIVAGSVSCISD